MIVADELRALRVDERPQREAQAGMGRRLSGWRDSVGTRAVDTALEAFDRGAPLAELPALAALVSGGGARAFANGLVDAIGEVLGDSPLARIPLRHTNDRRRSSLLLAKVGRASLSLQTCIARPGGEERATSCVLADMDSWDMVLSGAVEGRSIAVEERGGKARFESAPVSLRAGETIYRDGRREVFAVERIERHVTVLRLQRRGVSPEPARAFDLVTGALLRQAAGDVADSRTELMLALLGRMERVDQSPLMEEIGRGTQSPAVRWEAVRECLALDTASGFGLLGELARRSDDPLREEAAALRAQLVQCYPQLGRLEATLRCPA